MSTLPRVVNDIMSRHVIRVASSDTIRRALGLMIMNHLSALPVVSEEDVCLGMLSISDLIHLYVDLSDAQDDSDSIKTITAVLDDSSQRIGNRRVAPLMSVDPCTVSPEASIPEAARLMAQNGIHRLPVVDEAGCLLGIVSTMDVARVMGKLKDNF